MAINRYELVARHNPVLKQIEYTSPLTIGNGEFAFTADVTGLQTLYEEYFQKNKPLCTMSQWGWHSRPVNSNIEAYTLEDVEMTEYDYADRKVHYAVDCKLGNEEVYYWLRQNPHRFNLGRIGLLFDGKQIREEDITEIDQTLLLYEGVLNSQFKLHGISCRVQTSCSYESDTIGIVIESELLEQGRLSVQMAFPYGSPELSASDWQSPKRHTTKVELVDTKGIQLNRTMDTTAYTVLIKSDHELALQTIGDHEFALSSNQSGSLSFSITFDSKQEEIPTLASNTIETAPTVDESFASSRNGWSEFWKTTGVVELYQSKDSRAKELERRIILSLYQSRVQCCGALPPQETGLTCNSWHGKFHLEMYLWHMAYLPLWNNGEMMEPSIDWYLKRIPEAKENAARNGYRGAKWPKQVAYDGIDSPSPIATLLIWQQPHIIYMLELAYQSYLKEENKPGELTLSDMKKSDFLLDKYWLIIKETADYMVDLAIYNEATGRYDLVAPVIPAQEAHDPRITLNPIFEVEYWRFTLFLAAQWAKRKEKEEEAAQWIRVAEEMAELPMRDGLYLAHENCPMTYEEFNKDHPMMTAVYGLINSDRVDPEVMRASLHKIMECWDLHSTWGWDFAMMAMTATRLGLPDLAIDLLLMDTANNHYAVSGNNTQKKREDLPVYLPGNGSLLLAVAMMTSGYNGSEELPGFPKDSNWEVAYENIHPFPY